MTRNHPGLTVPQVSMVTGADQATVRSWIRRRHLTRNRLGRIAIDDLLTYLDERGTVGQHKRARQFGLSTRARVDAGQRTCHDSSQVTCVQSPGFTDNPHFAEALQ